MTQASIPGAPSPPFSVTHRSILSIAIPMTLAYLTTPLLGVVDTAIVGQFGDAALLGGLATGAIVFSVVFASFNFLRSGTTGLVAQASGRDDAAEEQAVFWRAFALAVVAGTVLALLAPLVALAGQWFMGAEPRVDDAMSLYLRIRLLGAPVMLVNYALLGYVLGRGEGALALLLQTVLNLGNIALSILLGLKLGWGVAGVAWGTVGGELAAMLLGMAIVLRRFSASPRLARARLVDRQAFSRMISVNRDIMIRTFSLLVAFALLTRQGVRFGTSVLAANSILMNLFFACAFFLDGLATAAEQLAGRSVGARNENALRRTVNLTCLWGFAFAVVATLALLLFGQDLIGFVTSAEDVRAAAVRYLPWAAFTALSGVLAFQMDGIFIGATWSTDMRNMMLWSLLVFIVALYGLAQLFENHGLWMALHLFLIFRGVSLLVILRRKLRTAF